MTKDLYASGYKPFNGFREVNFQTTTHKKPIHLKASWIETPLGSMLAIADNEALYLLEFVDRRGLEREIERMSLKMKAVITEGQTKPILSIESELKLYFEGKLATFKTPLLLQGTPFQKSVWEELLKIPLGETRSYSDIANALGKPTAYRAVALANGSNKIAVAIPCHRVIKANGELCGYAGGVSRKQWLLNNEKSCLSTNTSL